MSLRIKICGITNLEDAQAAIEAGADALGFMLYEKSSRFVTQKTAASIIRELPPFVAKVGVFVDADRDQVFAAVETCGLDTLQFHGSETPAFCDQFASLKTIKAFRVMDADSLGGLSPFHTDAWLLDSYVPGQLGGTGATFNWELAREAKSLGRPVILAGGLNAENISEAIRLVGPYAIDVSSGVEVEGKHGKKDKHKLQIFISEARNAFNSL